ncbi:DUF58 domain-containing protein [Hathewaya histolytica]|uniref:DUF58 domain-containing protein n=1 Tax=Hathewaya histolytica TaxID=1498 RepID=UPI003B682589
MYIIFICILIFLLYKLSNYTKEKGFQKLEFYRELSKKSVFQEEEFKVSTVLENRKKLPISFIYIKERFPSEFQSVSNNLQSENEGFKFNVSRYSLKGYEKGKRTIRLKAKKRGVYTISQLEITIGDIFGFSTTKKEFLNYLQLVVYPKVINIDNYKFSSTNLFGDNVIKRWIYKDPLFIKGIREYTIGDRMKDIHWSSSAKMNKLMVKEYDYTSDREVIIIVNVDFGDGIWRSSHEGEMENAISIAASIATYCVKAGISTGMWTNAKVMSENNERLKEVKPSVYSLKGILELCARMYYMKDISFIELLKNKEKKLKNNCTYIIIASFIDEDSLNFLYSLSVKGIDIILIDVSSKLKLPKIRGIQKLDFRGLRKNDKLV